MTNAFTSLLPRIDKGDSILIKKKKSRSYKFRSKDNLFLSFFSLFVFSPGKAADVGTGLD